MDCTTKMKGLLDLTEVYARGREPHPNILPFHIALDYEVAGDAWMPVQIALWERLDRQLRDASYHCLETWLVHAYPLFMDNALTEVGNLKGKP